MKVFGNSNPIALEVGMGKGRFIMDMAELYPDWNFVGIEMYDSVLLRAIQKMDDKTAKGCVPGNLRFLRMDARELPEVFAKDEVCLLYTSRPVERPAPESPAAASAGLVPVNMVTTAISRVPKKKNTLMPREVL